MHINGASKSDSLHGTDTNDVINGGKGNDFLWGHGGDDILTGDSGADVFVFSAGGGHDTIADFNPTQGDVLVFSYNTPLDAMFIGPLHDGMTWTTDSGGTGSVVAGDFNGDGHVDTEIHVNDARRHHSGLGTGLSDRLDAARRLIPVRSGQSTELSVVSACV